MSSCPETFVLNPSRVDLRSPLGWTKPEAVHIAKEILAEWGSDLVVASPERKTTVQATLRARHEGRSTAQVIELAFTTTHAEPRSVAKFIIREHRGPTASEMAERERRLVKHLNATSPELFSAEIYRLNAHPDLIVYRHADDQIGATSTMLHDAVIEVLRTRNTAAVPQLGQALRNLAFGVIRTYDTFESRHSLTPVEDYAVRVKSRLPPDLERVRHFLILG